MNDVDATQIDAEEVLAGAVRAIDESADDEFCAAVGRQGLRALVERMTAEDFGALRRAYGLEGA